jgi:putative endonuclease
VSYWTYILCNTPLGTLYVGMTNDIIAGFTKRYGIKRLVYFEEFATPGDAIAREKTLKRWTRAWKVALIERENPNWDDLYDGLARWS